MADQAGWSRVLAGVQFPSDDDAGAALGQRVAEQVIAQGARPTGLTQHGPERVPTGPVQLERHEPGQRHRRELEAAAAVVRRPVPCRRRRRRVTRRRCRQTGDGRNTPRGPTAFVDQLQGVLLAEPRRPEHLGLPLRGQVDGGGSPRHESAARGARLRAGRRRRSSTRSSPARTASSRTGTSGRRSWTRRSCPFFPVPAIPELPVEPLDVLGGALRDPRLPVPDARRRSRVRWARRAGDSRIWAGIHYPMDNVAGVNLGRSVGAGRSSTGRSTTGRSSRIAGLLLKGTIRLRFEFTMKRDLYCSGFHRIGHARQPGAGAARPGARRVVHIRRMFELPAGGRASRIAAARAAGRSRRGHPDRPARGLLQQSRVEGPVLVVGIHRTTAELFAGLRRRQLVHAANRGRRSRHGRGNERGSRPACD